MFEEFDPTKSRKDKRRIGASLAVSSVVYLSLAAGVVAASAAARQAIKEDDLVQIEVAPPPVVEPPPVVPPPLPAATPPSPRPKVERKALEVPKEIPQEKPPEAEQPLGDAPAAGAGQQGFSDGVAGGTGTAPAPAPAAVAPEAPKATGPIHLPESATPPVAKSGNVAPVYPEEARKAGLQAVVIAKVTIGADGKVTKVDVLRGPEIFHAPVKAALMSWQYEPARLPDGTAISIFRIVQLPFKLENM
jgi:protein TonB